MCSSIIVSYLNIFTNKHIDFHCLLILNSVYQAYRVIHSSHVFRYVLMNNVLVFMYPYIVIILAYVYDYALNNCVNFLVI